jgi:hypothetical protein
MGMQGQEDVEVSPEEVPRLPCLNSNLPLREALTKPTGSPNKELSPGLPTLLQS